MQYSANEKRYEKMIYKTCGRSGLKLSAVSLGLWHNFGETDSYAKAKNLLLQSFDLGITCFDIANNYGPPAGSAEETFGRIYKSDLFPYRDEIIVTSKAGFYMWPGPYGEWGSKKSLMASIDRSLMRTGLDYFDIFYHHRPDDNTPIEETIEALSLMVQQGKALYVGISNYNAVQSKAAFEAFEKRGIKCLIHQTNYSMFNRHSEDQLFNELEAFGVGAIAYSPLAQGLLTDKYFNEIPLDSRAAGHSVFLTKDSIQQEKIQKSVRLNEIAKQRGQTLAQMALAWVLRQKTVCSVLVGASKIQQVQENIKALDCTEFTQEELKQIDNILEGGN